ncbi:MAG: TIR domain-containing protein [Chloroflexi bacterium]|nr:TIR domain-containing protein [Bacteroidota bacterium]MCL5109866.1 TIR domain-containing protein [Chloroflexota bacterium]
MAKKPVCVSFDFENDRGYKYLMEAWDANPNFDFVFADVTPNEIQSNSIPRIKAVLTSKINSAKYTIVIIGKEANKRHKDYKEIGYRNWLNFEIARSKDNNNKLVAVKIDATYESPEEILGAGAKWAMSFTQANILKALNEA